ncbi:MAG TPA: ThiF family adenylyltransferase, partial [Chloroflexota bacterium]
MTGESTSAVEQTNWPTLLQLGDLACAHAFMKARLAISSDGTEAARFAVNLLVRLNKRFDIFGPDATDIADQARAILPDALINANPQVTLPYAGLLRVGHGPLVASGWQRQLGSTGWCARLGTEENTGNPVAQMAVACLGVASLLRHFMGTDVPAEWTFSLLDYDRADSPITPVGQTIGATTLFGLGGLGSPFLYAVRALELRGGPLGLVDFDVVDDTNLQRYAFNVWADRGQAKVAVAAARLAGLPLIVQPYNQTFR